MDDLSFKDVQSDNRDRVRRIKLQSGQENFIESVEECLQEAQTDPDWHPVAIYKGQEVIGFAMYGSFGPDKETWIDRIMIDAQYQGQGLGKIAMEKLMAVVSQEYGVKQIYLSIIEGNEIASRLYKSLGFQYTNERDPNGEFIFRYDCRNHLD